MMAYEDNRHVWVVYMLCSLAALAVVAAVVIPGIEWMLRPANCLSVVIALSLLCYVKVFRGWGQLVIYLMILGITQNCLWHSVIK